MSKGIDDSHESPDQRPTRSAPGHTRPRFNVDRETMDVR